MADQKIITDELLKLQTEKILQVVADNLYELEEYDEESIDDMFDATPQEISYYESLINPDVVSENRLWSSKTIDEKLASAILEANKYTDQASTRNLTTEIVSSTADVTKENVLYLILSDASTNTYEQYMLIGGTATALGSTQVDLSNIYNKSEVDTKLDDKANKSEVLSIDSVKSTIGSETNNTVYSSKLTKDELDKKANDDEVVKTADIVTTIDSASTNTKVPSAKATWDSLYKICDAQVLVDANNPTSKICMADLTTLNTPSKEGMTSAESSLIISIEGRDYWNGQISITMAEPEVYVRSVRDAGTWTKWRKLCSSNVADNSPAEISSFVDTDVSGTVNYRVKNGICFVKLWGVQSATTGRNKMLLNDSSLPKPSCFDTGNALFEANGDGTSTAFAYVNNNGALYIHFYKANSDVYGSFSYPVAE